MSIKFFSAQVIDSVIERHVDRSSGNGQGDGAADIMSHDIEID